MSEVVFVIEDHLNFPLDCLRLLRRFPKSCQFRLDVEKFDLFIILVYLSFRTNNLRELLTPLSTLALLRVTSAE